MPYSDLLQKQLPHNKGTDVRFVKRIFSLLNLVRVVVKLKLRKLFVLEGETSVIADFEDLKEVLSMIQNFEGLPKFKLDFLKDVFIPCYESKDSPDVQNEGGKAEKREEIIAVTTRELCEFYKDKNGKSINTDNLKRTFLNQLINEGLIDYTVSQIHGKQYIYYPLVTESLSILSIMTQRDEHSQQSKGIYEKITENITADWISSKIMQLIRYRIGQGYNMENLIDYLNNEKQFLIMDDEGNSRISLQKFVKIYPPTLSQSMTIRAQFLPFLPKRAISCRFWAKLMSEMSPLLPLPRRRRRTNATTVRPNLIPLKGMRNNLNIITKVCRLGLIRGRLKKCRLMV